MFLLLLFSDRAASDAPFCPAFSKAGKMFPLGNAQMAALPPENACEASGALLRGLQNLETPCSDVQKIASGKFLCVGDRRNRENCERM